jgi:hypothetical protein
MKKIVRTKAIELIAVLLGLIGLILSISDGEWFPWPNLIGILMILLIVKCISWPDDSSETYMRRS